MTDSSAKVESVAGYFHQKFTIGQSTVGMLEGRATKLDADKERGEKTVRE